MAETLPPEQEASYSAIIDAILASSDLETISAKRIRKGLQEQVDYDIAPQKDAITALIMARFDKISAKQETSLPEPAPTTNGTTKHAGRASSSMSPTKRKATSSASPQNDDDDDLSDVADSPRPSKKAKKSKAVETDEQIAKRMQAELNAPNARSTRGGGSGKKKAVVKKATGTPSKTKTKKKSKAKIRSEDDSEVESGSEDDKPAKQRTGGFHKPYTLSQPLSEMLGQTTLSRPQTVKQIWNYVKERDLQDPNDKRQIRCDDAMRAVFKQDKVHMFTMNKLLAQHLYAADE